LTQQQTTTRTLPQQRRSSRQQLTHTHTHTYTHADATKQHHQRTMYATQHGYDPLHYLTRTRIPLLCLTSGRGTDRQGLPAT
jgi:hypothetical protein